MANTTTAPANGLGAIDRFFKITERGSTIGTEIRGGLVTFFAMAYIIVLNPIILGNVPDGTGELLAGGDTAQIAAVTALVAGVMTILMGVFANFPLALAAGLGLNAVVAYSIATIPGMTWADAMGIIVLEGLIILILVLTGFREAVFKAVPHEIKVAISVGIGLFIAFIGFVDAGFVRIPASLATPVELGIGGSLSSWPIFVFVIGLFLAIILMIRKVRGAILIAIVAGTVLAVVVEAIGSLGGQSADNPGGWKLNIPQLADGWGLPSFGILGNFSLLGSFRNIGVVAVILLVFTLMLADFFDTMGTMVAVGGEAGLLDAEGNPPKTRQILIVDSVAAAAGGVGSVSSNTSYIESAAGVGDGARTGLASVVTGLAFLLAMFAAPVVEMVPYEAATPALVVVGFLMLTQVTGIDWKNHEVALPAFLTIVLMPFTYSITAGIGAGIISYVVIKLVVGKGKAVHPFLYGAAVLFVLYFLQGPLRDWVGF
ncbi:NCS2 family permease [Xylanimonas ulmi]|uniref:AGZA family xanthine/uracil permease-like MFS transporter n=1 Tax=Xylanimonas ulmi TaxID=228973 RepID=A0A4Q7M3Z1_9MICO|nr:NCS2 family permease [Xylanibacterium ulmi]RZS62071.1 AGZA family xanthine/uracil permease-like MFS transporter [Xylanibacterium ulmi]